MLQTAFPRPLAARDSRIAYDNPDARAAVESGGFPRLNEELSQPKSHRPGSEAPS
jgi:hypothetical protein